MAPLKFRAWDKTNKEMVAVEGLDNLTGGKGFVQVNEVGRGWIVDAEDLIIEQSTGLKDKNGVEIFEGDVGRVYGDGGVALAVQMIWDEAHACFAWQHISHEGGRYWDNPTGLWTPTAIVKYLEVIGNIHENPELLS